MLDKKQLTGLVVPAVMFLVGAGFAGNELLIGHSFATNDGMVWTLPLVAYMWLALSSTGVSIVLAAGELFGLKAVKSQKKTLLILAISLLIGAFAALFTELGSPLNAFWMLLSPNLTSPIWYMGAFYSVELVLLGLKLWRELRGQQGALDSVLARATLFVALAACTTLGSVFGTAIGRTGFAGVDASVLTVLLALASGGAALVLGSGNEHRPLFAKVLRYGAAVVTFFVGVKWIYLTHSSEMLRTDWVNPGMFVLFALSALISLHLPRVAAFITLLASLWTELAFVVSGQFVVLGPKTTWLGSEHAYLPNLPELGILVFGIGTALLVLRMMHIITPWLTVKSASV